MHVLLDTMQHLISLDMFQKELAPWLDQTSKPGTTTIEQLQMYVKAAAIQRIRCNQHLEHPCSTHDTLIMKTGGANDTTMCNVMADTDKEGHSTRNPSYTFGQKLLFRVDSIESLLAKYAVGKHRRILQLVASIRWRVLYTHIRGNDALAS